MATFSGGVGGKPGEGGASGRETGFTTWTSLNQTFWEAEMMRTHVGYRRRGRFRMLPACVVIGDVVTGR